MPSDEPEGPGDADSDLLDESDDDLATCFECGHSMYASADRCPHCGAWQEADSRSRPRKLGSVVMMAVVILIVIALALM